MRRTVLIGCLTVLLCAGAAVNAGCPAETNTGVLPITAVDIDIGDLLNGANLGCGTAPGQVYKYAAVIEYAKGDDAGAPEDCPEGPILAGGVTDCFAAGTFGNLPLPNGGALPDGGSITYAVWIYFYTYDDYVRVDGDAGQSGLIEKAVTPTPGVRIDVTPVCKLPYTWATTCIATEENNIAVNASCGPVTCQSKSCGLAPPEASSEAASEASSDAPKEAQIGDGKAETQGEAASDALSDALSDAPSHDGGD